MPDWLARRAPGLRGPFVVCHQVDVIRVCNIRAADTIDVAAVRDPSLLAPRFFRTFGSMYGHPRRFRASVCKVTGAILKTEVGVLTRRGSFPREESPIRTSS